MYGASIRDSGGLGAKRDSYIVEIQKYSVAWIDGLEHGLFDGEERLIAKAGVGKTCPFVRLPDKVADVRHKGHRRLDINTDTAEAIGWRDDSGCKLPIMSDGSGYSIRPYGIPSGRSRNCRYGNPEFPAQGARDVAASTACLPYRQDGSLKALRFHCRQELLVSRFDRPYLADATCRQCIVQKAI
jgi:hypothetical protein